MSSLPKGKKRPLGDKVSKFIGEFPDLYYDGVKIICSVCNTDLMCWDKYDCKRHVNSMKHVTRKNGVPLTTQFMFDLLFMLISCGVPLHILDKQPFREFWNKYNPDVKLPSRTTLRDYVPTVCDDIVGKIKCVLKNTYLWLCVGEMTDSKKNCVVNVVVRVLDPLKPTLPLLLASSRVKECTSRTITRVVLETLEKFELLTTQVLMFVTDGAATMRLVGHSLQEHGCKLIHVTCKLYALHLVAETIREGFPDVDALIASTKKVFLKSPEHLRTFHSKCPSIPEPPHSNPSCWGTWLKEAFYYAEYYEELKAVILQFNPDEAAAIKESQTEFEDISTETALKYIHKNYKGLHDAIEKLENGELPLVESLQIVDEVLQVVGNTKNEFVREKFASELKEDTGFTRLRQICEGTAGASSDSLSAYKDYFKYACITSTDVERSFSEYNHIFSSQRTQLTETTLETFLMLQSFYRSSPVCEDQASSSS